MPRARFIFGVRSRFEVRIHCWRWLLRVAAAFVAVTPLGAAPLSTNLLSPAVPLPDASLSAVRVLGALALVLALFLGAVWLFRNWQRVARPRGGSSPRLRVLETRALGQRHLLFVVAYEEQRMLLATSPNGVSLVSHLPAAQPLEAPPEKISSPSFVAALQEAVQRKA
jgi:flagellar biosynthetic protein FliO